MFTLAGIRFQFLLVIARAVQHVIVRAVTIEVAHPHEMHRGTRLDRHRHIRAHTLVRRHRIVTYRREFAAIQDLLHEIRVFLREIGRSIHEIRTLHKDFGIHLDRILACHAIHVKA